MGNKKNIDKYFQEQFKNFEATPPESVWDNINNELEQEEKEERKIVPFWWKLSGIAASLLFLITVGVSQFSSEKNKNVIVNEDNIKVNQNDLNSEISVVENEIDSKRTTKDKQLNEQVSVEKNNAIVDLNSNDIVIKDDDLSVISSSKNNLKTTTDYVSGDKISREKSIKLASQVANDNKAHKNSAVFSNEKHLQKTIERGDAVVERSNTNNRIQGLKNVEKSTEIIAVNQPKLDVSVSISEKTDQRRSVNTQNTNTKTHFEKEFIVDKVPDNTIADLANSNVIGRTNKNEEELLVKEAANTVNSPLEINKETMFNNDKKSLHIADQGIKTNVRQVEKALASNVEQLQDGEGNKRLDSRVSEEAANLSSSESNMIDMIQSTLLVGNDTTDALVKNKSTNDENSEELGVEDETVSEDELPIEQTIEEAIAEQELKKEEDTDEDKDVDAYTKWKIAPNVAPVYYNSLTSGSPIDGDFKGNKKKGQFTTSYGIGVGYAINKRLSVRTGVNRLEVGYDTEDVAIYSSPETSDGPKYKNINFSSAGSAMSIAGSGTYSATQIPAAFSSLFDSSLNQRFGYLEVPLELSYKLSDKKLRVDVIAGMSTFFLNKNEIYSENKAKTTYIGEANNLNKMTYSTNLGIGLEYKISKSLNFNFDPTFKYQLNAFSNDSGNFKPYIIGIYTGLSYRF